MEFEVEIADDFEVDFGTWTEEERNVLIALIAGGQKATIYIEGTTSIEMEPADHDWRD